MPLFNCFAFIGSAFSIYLNISGEKLVILENAILSGSQRIPYLKVPGIRQTDNITSQTPHPTASFFTNHESRRTTETHHLTEAYMLIVKRYTSKRHGTNLHKSDTTAMVRVHIRMDLENEAGEIILIRVYHTLYRMDRTWRGAIRIKQSNSSFTPKLSRRNQRIPERYPHPNTYSHQIRDKPPLSTLYPHEASQLAWDQYESRDPD